MKISVMIKRLEEQKAEHGDIEVSVFDQEENEKGYLCPIPAHIVIFEDQDNQVMSVVLTDAETADA